MKFITIALVVQFLISCWPKINIINRIRQQYGQKSLVTVRKCEKTYPKLKKLELDLKFLYQCQTKDLVPSFCRLKPANRHGLSRR